MYHQTKLKITSIKIHPCIKNLNNSRFRYTGIRVPIETEQIHKQIYVPADIHKQIYVNSSKFQ